MYKQNKPYCIRNASEEPGLHLTNKHEVGHSAITAYNGGTKQVSDSTAHSKVTQPELSEL